MLQIRVGLLVSVWLILAGAVWAQSSCSATVTGRVMCRTDQQPLPGATVYVRELRSGDVADRHGYVQLKTICPGRYTLDYQYVGYKPETVLVDVSADSVQVLATVQLQPDGRTLQEVQVSEHRSEAGQLLQTQAALTGSALDATRGQSLGESLKALTGLYSIQTGPGISKPVIHGLYSNRILTLNNGVRQEDQQWGSEHAPQIDPFLASRLTVIKGVAGVRYGSDAIGGVILVEPKPMPTAPGFGGEVNVVGGTNGRQGTVSALIEQGLGGKLAGLSWRVQGTLRRVGYTRTPNYFLENSSYHENNLSAAVQYVRAIKTGVTLGTEVFYSQFNTRLGLFTGAQVGSLADFYAAIARLEPLQQPGFSYALGRPYQQIGHELLKVKSFLQTERWGTLTTTIAQQQNQRSEYDLLSFSRVTDPELYLKLTTQTADVVWEHKPVKNAAGGQFSGSVGFNGITQGNVRRFLFLIPNYRNYGVGLFALERYARDRWTVEAGVRYDYRWLRAFFRDEATDVVTFTTRQWQNVSGSLGATYQLNPQLTVSATLGTAWRAPNVNELYANGLHQSAVAYERGNPNLQTERARELNTLLTYTGKRLYMELNLYTNWIDNYIYLKPDSVPIVRQRGAFPAFSYTQVRATFRGIDATIRYRLSDRLTIISKTSLLHAFDHTNQDYLVYIPPNRTDNSVRYELGGKGKISGLYVSLNSLYVARQNRVPAVTQQQENGFIIFVGDFAPPPPAYSLLGAEAGFAWQLGRQQLNVILTGSNLLNATYRDYLNRFRYFADEPGRNLMLKLRLPLFVHRHRV